MLRINFPGDVIKPLDSMPEKIYALPEFHKYPYRVNLADYLVGRTAAVYPNNVAIYFKDQTMTYRELFSLVNRLANGLRGLGIGEYDRVLLMGANSPEWIISVIACWKIGAIPVLVNHLVKSDEITYRANDISAKAIVCSYACLAEVEKADYPSLIKIVHGDKSHSSHVAFETLLEKNSDSAKAAATTLHHIVRIIYSSGTTGRPKGIISTANDHLACIDTHAKYVLQIRSDDVLGGHPYFTFAFGSVNYTFHPWRFGAAISIIDRFEPEEMFHTIKSHRITKLFGVPTAFRMMLSSTGSHEEGMRSVRLCQSAGEPLSGATYKEWKERYGIEILDSMGSGDLMYWLSTHDGLPEEKIGSTGISIPGVENKIVDENFAEVPRGTPGELLVRGPFGQVYWNKPEKQKNAVHNGWNRPGIYAMEDEDGYFWYLSRTDDIIVTSGYKIPCGEVENALNLHHAVLESAAIPSPDPIRGTVVKAFVVLRQGFQPSDDLVRDLKGFVKNTIEDYKYPRQIVFVEADDLPRTTTGKIQRNVLRERENSPQE